MKTIITCRGKRFVPHHRHEYKWIDNGSDWEIRQYVSLFLIARGSGYSRRIGRELFARLTAPAGKKA